MSNEQLFSFALWQNKLDFDNASICLSGSLKGFCDAVFNFTSFVELRFIVRRSLRINFVNARNDSSFFQAA